MGDLAPEDPTAPAPTEDASDGGEDRDLNSLIYEVYERQLQTMDREENLDVLVAAHLDAPQDQIVSSVRMLPPLMARMVGRVLATQIRARGDVVVRGPNPHSPPLWTPLRLVGTVEAVPAAATILLAAEPPGLTPLVARLTPYGNDTRFEVLTHLLSAGAGLEFLEGVIDSARGPDNPYRGKVVRSNTDAGTLDWEVETLPARTRGSLIVPRQLWRDIDTNVRRVFERTSVLQRAGLGSNRGVMLVGQPGTGKTAACSIVASELAGSVTVAICESRTVQYHLRSVYDEVAYLAPALVILEDLDLIVGRRDDVGDRGSLVELLATLDGLMTRDAGIVTIATTNDAEAIDPAARRAARFDAILHFPLPDGRARARILRRYLQELESKVDCDVVAQSTDGATGADLRELVRLCVLTSAEPIQTDAMLKLALGMSRARSWKASIHT